MTCDVIQGDVIFCPRALKNFTSTNDVLFPFAIRIIILYSRVRGVVPEVGVFLGGGYDRPTACIVVQIWLTLLQYQPSNKKPRYWSRLDFFDDSRVCSTLTLNTTALEFVISPDKKPRYWPGLDFLFDSRECSTRTLVQSLSNFLFTLIGNRGAGPG